ncbi:MAG: hypothetical protein PHG02_04570 [Oscillospiraceae bacterium]|nr:hypothetical protein [Oscillospiraceae bacterium]
MFPTPAMPDVADNPAPVKIPATSLGMQPTAPTPPTTLEPTLPDAANYEGGVNSAQYIADLESYNTEKQAYDKEQADYTQAKATYDTDIAAYNTLKQQWEDYNAYMAKLNTYNKAVAAATAFPVWYNYFKSQQSWNNYVANMAATAAANTVVKTAHFKPGQDTAFTVASKLDKQNNISQVYLPNGMGNGSVSVYAGAVAYTLEEEQAEAARYNAFLDAMYPDRSTDAGSKALADYRKVQQQAQRDLYGKVSAICIAVAQDQTVKQTVVELTNSQVIGNMEFVQIGTKNYVAYTTSRNLYVNSAGTLTEELNDIADMLTVHRLNLREVIINADGSAQLGACYVLRTLSDYANNTVTDTVSDGTVYQDPSFGNLQFLSGVLQGGAAETFLLFDMNGSTYVVTQANIQSIVSGGAGEITPFFTPPVTTDSNGAQTQDGTTGKVETTIGADGAGNIAAVYAANVSNTGNNALYITRYDPQTATWGEGVMLAMNHMDAYEKTVEEGLSAQEAEAAYLDTDAGGGMDSMLFSNIQFAMGQKASVQTFSETPAGDMMETTAQAMAQEQADAMLYNTPAAANDTLLVLTQGSLTYLKEWQAQDAKFIGPMNESEMMNAYMNGTYQDRKYGVGLYAVSYGIGGQSIGEDSIQFDDYNFSAGSRLITNLSFKNTGDVAIRASANQPATVKLWVTSPNSEGAWNAQELAKWQITDKNIKAGQTVQLNGRAAAFAENLPVGSIFYITVAEDEAYTEGNGFTATTLVYGDNDQPASGTFVIQARPELGFESFNLTPTGVDENGNTVIDVNFQVGNRGNSTAIAPYVQFTYQSGVDENGTAVYSVLPLNLPGTNLEVSQEQQLALFALFGVGGDDKSLGILRLKGTDGADIREGYGRTVTGKLVVPAAAYTGGESKSLNVRAEIYSDADTINGDDVGVVLAAHGEYDILNNTQQKQIERTTYFTSATKITLALGNTMRLPVSLAATANSIPNIVVSEVPDQSETGNNLGILYYSEMTAAVNGYSEGTVVIAPSQEGSGVIHVKDISTNTTHAITYTVTPSGDGINIYKDNNMFTFINANGTEYDDAAQQTQTWSFRSSIPLWGTNTDEPYRNDLAYAQEKDCFKFVTVAEEVEFELVGSAKVESTFPGFETQIITGDGAEKRCRVTFGENPTGYQHTVTVTGVAELTMFDRIIEHFAGGVVPLPADDTTAPHIFYNRSFPQTASIDNHSHTDIAVTCYIVDDNGLSSVLMNDMEPAGIDKQEDMWTFSWNISQNGTYTLVATDTSGNITKRNIVVDWFNDVPSSGAIKTAPVMSTEFQYADGAVIGQNDFVTKGKSAHLQVSQAQNSKPIISKTVSSIFSQVLSDNSSELRISQLEAATDGRYDIAANGLYYVMTTAEDETWQAQMLRFNNLDVELPVLSLTVQPTTYTSNNTGMSLAWSVTKSKNSRSAITQVSINGYPLNITGNQTMLAGKFPVTYGGTYTMSVADAAGNENQISTTVEGCPIVITDSSAFVSAASWNKDKNNGAIAIDDTKIAGGTYVSGLSTPQQNQYCAAYEYMVDEQTTQSSSWLKDCLTDDSLWTQTLSHLAPGEHMVYVRDKNAPQNADIVGSAVVTVEDNYITIQSAVTSTEGDTPTGKIDVKAEKGKDNTGLYQYLLLPMQEEQVKLTELQELETNGGTWKSFESLDKADSYTFEGLTAGQYQVAVREMLGLSTQQTGELQAAKANITAKESILETVQEKNNSTYFKSTSEPLQNDIAAALAAWQADWNDVALQQAYEALISENGVADTDVLDALQVWRNAQPADRQQAEVIYKEAVVAFASAQVKNQVEAKIAQAQADCVSAESSYEAKLQEITDTTAQAYEADTTLWDNATTAAVTVKAVYPVVGSASESPAVIPQQQKPVDDFWLQALQQLSQIKDGATLQFNCEGNIAVPNYIWQSIWGNSKILIVQYGNDLYYFAAAAMPKNFNFNSSHNITEFSRYKGEAGKAYVEGLLGKAQNTENADSSYIARLLETVNEQIKITLNGEQISKDAKLSIVPITQTENLTEELAQKMFAVLNGQGNVLAAYEISLSEGDFKGQISITIEVGKEHEGKVLTVLHFLQDGTYERADLTVVDGKITMIVSSLSPFIVLDGVLNAENLDVEEDVKAKIEAIEQSGTSKDMPKAVTVGYVSIAILAVLLLAAGTFIWLRKKEKKED